MSASLSKLRHVSSEATIVVKPQEFLQSAQRSSSSLSRFERAYNKISQFTAPINKALSFPVPHKGSALSFLKPVVNGWNGSALSMKILTAAATGIVALGITASIISAIQAQDRASVKEYLEESIKYLSPAEQEKARQLYENWADDPSSENADALEDFFLEQDIKSLPSNQRPEARARHEAWKADRTQDNYDALTDLFVERDIQLLPASKKQEAQDLYDNYKNSHSQKSADKYNRFIAENK